MYPVGDLVVHQHTGMPQDQIGRTSHYLAQFFQPGEAASFDDGFFEGLHGSYSANMFMIRWIITSLSFGADSATSSASAARPTSLITGSLLRSSRPLR